MYSLIKKIAGNEKIILSLILLGTAIILLDGLSGFQGMTIPASDIWHHRAVLITLAENPLNPANPHILSDEGSRTFIPVYVLIGFFASLFGFSANVSLGISSIINLTLLGIGAKYFARSIGSKHYIFLLFILTFAWLLPPAYTGFHNLRALAHTNAFPAAHSFALTLITWGLFIETIKKSDLQLGKWILITFLLAFNILSHQLTALFCIGALFVYIFILPSNHIRVILQTIGTVTAAIILSILWPYFDIITVLNSASNSGWHGASWFYDPVSVIEISLPALIGLIFMFQLRALRLIKIMTFCGISIFLAYLGTHILDIDAGHRLLPYWIFFLQIILFIAFKRELSGSVQSNFIDKIKPLFICSMMIVAFFQCCLAVVDIYKPVLRYHYGWTFMKFDANFYYQAMEKVHNELPDDAIVIAFDTVAYPIQGFGIPVVSIPRQAPMIIDLSARQAATNAFFSKDLTCEQRLQLAAPYKATHAAYLPSQLNTETISQISELGNVVTYDGLISIVEIPDQCPNKKQFN